jgi:hypothetical protein|nr:hypothetical protein [Kofleriaceae bacterium]
MVLAVLVAGCFYEAPINQRPSAGIRNQPTDPVFRGDLLSLEAFTSDPDGNAVDVQWSIFACTDASDTSTDCDAVPFDSDTTQDTSFEIPPMRADGVTPTRALRVLLDATDELGAIARPTQVAVIAVDDHPPTLQLSQSSAHDYVVGSHISLEVDVSDLDDNPGSDSVLWTVDTPVPSAPYTLAPPQMVGSGAVAGHVTYRSSLDTEIAGQWTVHVTATDPLAQTTEQDFVLAIGSDLPPCITSPSPIASPSQALPLIEPTLFEVPIVVDDLDVYPPSQGGDPDLGVASFQWSIEQPGATSFTPLAVTGNGVPLDPATYSSGDVVKLSVEVHDRVTRDFSACDGDPTCTLNEGDPSCLQRITWTVEVP